METSSIACQGVNLVMIVVEFIENHPQPHDEYRPGGSRSQVPRPAQWGSYAEALGPPPSVTCGLLCDNRVIARTADQDQHRLRSPVQFEPRSRAAVAAALDLPGATDGRGCDYCYRCVSRQEARDHVGAGTHQRACGAAVRRGLVCGRAGGHGCGTSWAGTAESERSRSDRQAASVVARSLCCSVDSGGD